MKALAERGRLALVREATSAQQPERATILFRPDNEGLAATQQIWQALLQPLPLIRSGRF